MKTRVSGYQRFVSLENLTKIYILTRFLRSQMTGLPYDLQLNFQSV